MIFSEGAKKMRRSTKLAILTALTAGVNFCSQAEAYDADRLDFGGRQFIDFAFFNTGEKVEGLTEKSGSGYVLPLLLRDATKTASSYWSEMLGPRSGFTSPWQIVVVTQDNHQNAYAGTISVKNGEAQQRKSGAKDGIKLVKIIF